MNDMMPLPPSRAAVLLRPFMRFFQMEAAGGIVLLACAAVALVWANSPWSESYHELWSQYVRIGPLNMSLGHWINDGLMVVFFLLVGLEIKQEVVLGELSSLRKAALPLAAAVGGMVVPAGIYAAINWGGDGICGWGVPMATDIAFAVGVLALAGRRAPLSLKVFLLALAIVDDLGAVLVIALFYTSEVSMVALAVAGGFLAALVALNRLSVHRPLPYVLLGIGLWVATLMSGVHATVAGVLLAATIPAWQRIDERSFAERSKALLSRFTEDLDAGREDEFTEKQTAVVQALEQTCQAVQTPLSRLEHTLLWPVGFIIVPLFALANSGVTIGGDAAAGMTDAVMVGAFFGLVIGKPVGVTLFAYLAVKLGIAAMPVAATWRQLAAVSCICGIGFTMSLFIAILAFPERADLLNEAKIGVLAASLVMGTVGLAALFLQPAPVADPQSETV